MFIYGKGNDLTQIHNILRDEMNGDSERERERESAVILFVTYCMN